MADQSLIIFNKVQTDMQPTPNFNKLKQEIPLVVQKGKQLLSIADNEDVDEAEFDRVTKELKPIQQKKKQVDEEIKRVRKIFNDTRDLKINQLRNSLNQVGFDELDDIDKEIKNRKKLILTKRERQRWNELEIEFNETLDASYPKLKEKVPSFNFNMFYNAHPKLVSGAKTKKITAKTKATVADYIQNVSKDIETIESLESPYEDKLIRTYLTTEDITETIQAEKKFKKQAEEAEKRKQEEIERQKKKIEEENKRQEKIAKLKKEEAKKESTEHIDKLQQIYHIMNDVFKQGVTEDRSKDAITKIKEIVN